MSGAPGGLWRFEMREETPGRWTVRGLNQKRVLGPMTHGEASYCMQMLESERWPDDLLAWVEAMFSQMIETPVLTPAECEARGLSLTRVEGHDECEVCGDRLHDGAECYEAGGGAAALVTVCRWCGVDVPLDEMEVADDGRGGFEIVEPVVGEDGRPEGRFIAGPFATRQEAEAALPNAPHVYGDGSADPYPDERGGRS